MNKKQTANYIKTMTHGTMSVELLRLPENGFARRHLERELSVNGIDELYGALYDLFSVEGATIAEMRKGLAMALRSELNEQYAEA